MLTLRDALQVVAKAAGVTLLEVQEPTPQQQATARTPSAGEAQAFANTLARFGLQASALSRGHRHLVYIW